MSASTDTVKTGQHWIAPASTMPIRIMAVAEGYAMVRHKGCTPYTLSTGMIAKLYERVK